MWAGLIAQVVAGLATSLAATLDADEQALRDEATEAIAAGQREGTPRAHQLLASITDDQMNEIDNLPPDTAAGEVQALRDALALAPRSFRR